MDATNAPHETLRVYPDRSARVGLPHMSTDPPPAAPCDAVPAVGAAEGVSVAPTPAVRA